MQPIMDLLLLLARDKWPAVHSTLMLSEGWLNTLVPALTALAVHRAELDLDNSAAVLVLQVCKVGKLRHCYDMPCHAGCA